MSVIVYFELNMPVCDVCGNQLGAEYSAEAARSEMKRLGWGTQRVPADTVRASEQKLFSTSAEEGMVEVDLCALCMREGRRNPGARTAAAVQYRADARRASKGEPVLPWGPPPLSEGE